MKRFRPFLHLLGLVLAFAAGCMLNEKDKHKPLQVLYMGDAALRTTPPEQQVLALILADPWQDAQMAVRSKDFRRARTSGATPESLSSPESFKILPFGGDYIRSFTQKQVGMIAGNYIQAYNDSLDQFLSKPPVAAPAAGQASPPPPQAGAKP